MLGAGAEALKVLQTFDGVGITSYRKAISVS